MGLAHFSIGTATDRIDLLRNVRIAPESSDVRNIAFDVKVEPDKEVVITYTVKYTW